jgi:preprotein translocase subunit SecG
MPWFRYRLSSLVSPRAGLRLIVFVGLAGCILLSSCGGGGTARGGGGGTSNPGTTAGTLQRNCHGVSSSLTRTTTVALTVNWMQKGVYRVRHMFEMSWQWDGHLHSLHGKWRRNHRCRSNNQLSPLPGSRRYRLPAWQRRDEALSWRMQSLAYPFVTNSAQQTGSKYLKGDHS